MLIFTSFPKEINGNEIQNLFKTGGEKRWLYFNSYY